MNFVLDASVAMGWLLLDGKPAERAYTLKVLAAMRRAETRALVPVTWGLDVSNVIARAEAKGLLREAQSEAFLEMLDAMDIGPDPATFSRAFSETLQIARRYRFSSYDASCLALAMREGLPLATPDGTAIRDYIHVTDLVQGHPAALDWLARPRDVAVCYGDPGLARTALGWRAERSLDAMCRDVWNWQQSGSAA